MEDKLLFISHGPGETSQARALARYAVEKKKKVLFIATEKKNIPFLKNEKDFKVFLAEKPQKIKEVFEKEKPKAVLFFNSKIEKKYPRFFEKYPFSKRVPCLCFDSNWLFNKKKYPSYPFIKWADEYLIIFPKKIFKTGLTEFQIEKEFRKKLSPVGFIPSYKKPSKKIIAETRKEYNLEKDEKLIFSYFGGIGSGYRDWAFSNFISSVEKLIKEGRKIKAIYIGPEKIRKNWLIKKDSLPSDKYFFTLASSDLIFQHQGLATLSQAISLQIPVIANVSIKPQLPKLHFKELEPFKKEGTCKVFSKSTPISEISDTIEDLLYNKKVGEKMRKKQKAISKGGEEKAFKIIEKYLKS